MSVPTAPSASGSWNGTLATCFMLGLVTISSGAGPDGSATADDVPNVVLSSDAPSAAASAAARQRRVRVPVTVCRLSPTVDGSAPTSVAHGTVKGDSIARLFRFSCRYSDTRSEEHTSELQS